MFKHPDQSIGEPLPAQSQDASAALASETWAPGSAKKTDEPAHNAPQRVADAGDSEGSSGSNWYTPHWAPKAADLYGPDAKFDGTKLCDTLRDEMERVHRQLREPAKRQEFHQKWTPICQFDPRLATESGSDEIARNMVASLGERFDYYFDRSGFRDLQAEKVGAEIGIGIDTEIRGVDALRAPHPYAAKISTDHPLEITEIIPDSPAAHAHLQVGDRIVAVDGVSNNGLMRREVLAKIGTESGASVTLKIERPNLDGTVETREVTAKEQWINTETAKYESLGEGVGYIKLRNFLAEDVTDQMFKALSQTTNDKAIVIDLRNNNGGSVSAMETIAEQILARGSIYRLEQRNSDAMQTETRTVTDYNLSLDIARDGDITHTDFNRHGWVVPEEKPIVILVDEYSASAAELLAGILKGNKRAVLVGVPTTGKSEGQQPVPLPFGRQANLTDFEFYPANQPVPHTGLPVDVLVRRGSNPLIDNQKETAKAVALSLVHGVRE